MIVISIRILEEFRTINIFVSLNVGTSCEVHVEKETSARILTIVLIFRLAFVLISVVLNTNE